jgi:hypothetical protein
VDFACLPDCRDRSEMSPGALAAVRSVVARIAPSSAGRLPRLLRPQPDQDRDGREELWLFLARLHRAGGRGYPSAARRTPLACFTPPAGSPRAAAVAASAPGTPRGGETTADRAGNRHPDPLLGDRARGRAAPRPGLRAVPGEYSCRLSRRPGGPKRSSGFQVLPGSEFAATAEACWAFCSSPTKVNKLCTSTSSPTSQRGGPTPGR